MDTLNRRLNVREMRSAADVATPSALPGSTYAAPAAAPRRAGLDGVIASLSSISESVARIGARREDALKARGEAEAAADFGGMTLEQARAKVASGELDAVDNPYFRAAFLVRLGQTEAQSRKREMAARFAARDGVDPLKSDVEAWVREQTAADLAALPESKFARDAYVAEMGDFAARLQTAQSEEMVKETLAARRELARRTIGEALLSAREAPSAQPVAEPRAPASAPADRDALVRALVHVESRGNPRAVSPKGAMGRFQVMPDTARSPGYGIRPWDGTSQEDLERVGREYLAKMLEEYDGSLPLALAAYNAGPGRVNKWLKTIGDPRTGQISDEEWLRRLPIRETREYVPKIFAAMAEAGSPVSVQAEQGSSAPPPLPRPNGGADIAEAVFEAIEENVRTGLTTRREAEDMLVKELSDLAQSGQYNALHAILHYNRGPAGTLAAKLGAQGMLLLETALNKARAKEDDAAAARFEQVQFAAGTKADAGVLTDAEIAAIKKEWLDDRVAAGRRPIASGEYLTALVSRRNAAVERKAAEARAEAERAAEAAMEKERIGRIEAILLSGKGHELDERDETEGIRSIYGANRIKAGASPDARRMLDLATLRVTNKPSPFAARLMSGGSAALRSGHGVSADGVPHAQLADALAEYAFYRKNAPEALPAIIPSEQDRKLFDTYHVLTSSGWTREQALVRVAAIATGTARAAPLSQDDKKRIRAGVRDMGARLGSLSRTIGWIFGTETGGEGGVLFKPIDNFSAVVSGIEAEASTYMRAGASADAAVSLAMENAAKSWSHYDGILVNHRGADNPELFRRGLRPAMDKLFETRLSALGYDKNMLGRNDVVLAPSPSRRGVWVVFDRNNLGLPLATITEREIAEAGAAALDARRGFRTVDAARAAVGGSFFATQN